MADKSEIIYARISEDLKQRLKTEVNDSGEAEAVIIRTALKEYFARRDKPEPPARYPDHPSGPPSKFNEASAGNPVTPQDIAAQKLGHRAVSDLPGSPVKPPVPEAAPAARPVSRMHRRVSGIIRRETAAGPVRQEKRGK